MSDNRTKKQIKAWVKKAAKPPAKKAEAITLADKLVSAREWAAAEKCYQSVLEKTPRDFHTLMKIAYVQACSNQIEKAVTSYKKCFALDQENVDLLKNMAAMSNTLGRPEEGLEYGLKALSIADADASSHYLVAECYAEMQQKAEAAKFYENALTRFNQTHLDAHTLVKISRALSYLGKYSAALNCLNQAVQLNPNLPAVYFEMGKAFEQLKDNAKAKMAYRRTLELAPKHSEALEQYAELMASSGQLDKSAWAYRRLVKLFPDSATFQHFLKSTEQQGNDRADDQYIVDVFDSYATQFEEHLVDTLKYNTPEKIHEVFKPYWSGAPLNICDLGCGTGLCGPLFKSMSETLTGIDLSKAMLDEAKKKNVYDDLKVAELVSALKQEYLSRDLLVAADVLIYVGGLEDLFVAAKQALKPGGFFLFSVEEKVGEGFNLEVSGRFKHSKQYVLDLARKNSLHPAEIEQIEIRMEMDEPVMGLIFLLRKFE